MTSNIKNKGGKEERGKGERDNVQRDNEQIDPTPNKERTPQINLSTKKYRG